jgi:ParB family transcriptional regulator, chromosome partitioning protein
MESIAIRPMKQRKYRMISVDEIDVVNPRTREKSQFAENVRSIKDVGLYKPIVVNERNRPKLGKYELICGQGRLEAHRELGLDQIKADVLDIDERQAHLMTLGENIARTPPASIEFARAIKEMADFGMSFKELCAITGKSDSYVREYINLVEQGEERLIQGVEDGVFTLAFAINVARSSDRSIQHLLMDAFDSGLVNATNLPRVRRVIEDRQAKGKNLGGRKKSEAPYTVQKLKRDIQKVTRDKESFVQQAERRENRVTRLMITLKQVREDKTFIKLLREEGLDEIPDLAGRYA